MGLYKCEFGYHTPKKTKKVLNFFAKKCALDFVDSSWHNDLMDSIHHEIICEGDIHEFYEVYIPNSKENDYEQEKFNSYLVLDENQEHLFESKSIKKVVKFLNKKWVEKNIEKNRKNAIAEKIAEKIAEENLAIKVAQEKSEKLHENAIKMMVDLNDKYGRHTISSLDCYYLDFCHVLSNDEKEDMMILIKKFENI